MIGFSPRPARLSGVTAAILAGGLGTRLRSAVADRPKVLAPVAGRPFAAYLLDSLAAAGVRRAVLLTGFRGDQVRLTLGNRFGEMELAYSEEASPLGTGGALRAALDQLDSDTIILLNGDSYCRVGLAAFLAFHRRRRAEASMALVRVENAARFGRVTTALGGRVTAFAEKEATRRPGWINAGVYLLKRSLISEIPTDRPISLERDLLPGWIRRRTVYGRRGREPFLDIGTPKSYAAAADFLAAHPAATAVTPG